MEVDDVFDQNYEYNCPQFVDFSVPQPNDDRADEWFDLHHEDGQPINFEVDPNACLSCQEPAKSESPKPVDTPVCQEMSSAVSPNHCPGSNQGVEDQKPPNLHHSDEEMEVEELTEAPEEQTATADQVDIVSQTETTITADAEKKEEVNVLADEKQEVDGKPHPEVVEEAADTGVTRTVDTKMSDNNMEMIEEENVEINRDEETKEDPVPSTETEDSPKQEPTENLLCTDTHNTEQDAPIEAPSSEVTTCTSSSTDAPALSSMHRVPKNLVTSWNSSNNENSATEDASTKNTRRKPVTKRLNRSLNSDTGLKRSVSGRNTERRSLRIQNRRSASTDSPLSKRRRTSDRSQSRDSAKKEKQMLEHKPFIPKLTMPTTPTFMKRSNTKPGTQFKSTEQLEMERIAMFRKKLAERKKQSQASYKKVQESTGYVAAKGIIPPTKPTEFKFETDSRIKQHPMETRQDRAFHDILRHHDDAPAATNVHRGPTVPKPFKLTESRKRKVLDDDTSGSKASSYTSVASQINQFHNKTPQRYHTRRSGDQQRDIHAPKEAVLKPKLTCPKTPNFECKNRKRPITVKSAAEKEEEELQEIQSYKFKANPVNPRVMSNVNIGMKMASHKEPTKPVGFNLELDRRIREREEKKSDEKKEEEQYEFHAKPVSSKMLEGPTGIAPVQPRSITCPKSPAFALKNRVRVKDDSLLEIEEKKPRIIKANPILHVGVPFRPQLSHKTTESQPFSFEQRDKEIQARKEAKIQEIYQEEEKARQFRAHPIPEACPIPEKKPKASTKPQPFKLSAEQGAKQAEIWSKKMEEELTEQRAKASAFRAKPANVLYNEPFVPQKPNKPLTDISEFALNTERRAAERDQFEQQKLRRELERREALHDQQRLQEEEEQREIARLRKEVLVHKANPVRHYKAVQVLPSDRPLTEACSPNFSDRFRSRTDNC